MSSHKLALITAAALASAGSLVACSSSDDSTSSEATASQSATEEETSSVEEEADPGRPRYAKLGDWGKVAQIRMPWLYDALLSTDLSPPQAMRTS